MRGRDRTIWRYKSGSFFVILIGICIWSKTTPLYAETNDRENLTIEQAIALAVEQDPWLTGSILRQDALSAEAVAAGTYPDPKVSINIANIAADSFRFDQEPMTQFKVGVSQALPRGDTRRLKRQKLRRLSEQYPLLREDRIAKLRVQVGTLWLEAYRAAQTIRLIEKDKALFEHLVDVAESSYASAFGKSRQTDLIRAQLELTRLQERLIALSEHKDMAQNKLSEWLPQHEGVRLYQVATGLPRLTLARADLVDGTVNEKKLLSQFKNHPSIIALDKQIAAGDSAIDLAEQGYKPQWGVNAAYGYRDADPAGNERADLFSVGISFDLPLFTENRQDQSIQSARAKMNALKTDKAIALRQLLAGFKSSSARLKRLDERQEIFNQRLLLQMHEQAEAALTAYTNDDGDFAEVVRARIAELNARIDAFNIQVDQLKTVLKINYFLTQAAKHNEIQGDTL